MNKHGSPLFILALVLAMGVLGLFGVSACARDRHAITSAAFPFCLLDDDSGERVTLYFLDGVGDLAFVELGDWQDLFNKVVGDEGDEQGYHLSLDAAGPVATYTRENGYTMVIDFDQDLFLFQEHNLFMRLPNMSTLLYFTSKDCFSEAGKPALIRKSDDHGFDRYGDELVLCLGDYDIDLILQDGLHLVPLQTMCGFTLAPRKGLNVFFNGQCVTLADRLSADNELYYATPTGMRSEELAAYGYSELCLMLDSLYGLREVHGIDSFGRRFQEIGFEEGLRGADPDLADRADLQSDHQVPRRHSLLLQGLFRSQRSNRL